MILEIVSSKISPSHSTGIPIVNAGSCKNILTDISEIPYSPGCGEFVGALIVPVTQEVLHEHTV